MAASINHPSNCDWCGHADDVPGCPGIVELNDDFLDDDDGAYRDDDLLDSEDYSPPTQPYLVPVDNAVPNNQRCTAHRLGQMVVDITEDRA